LTFSFTNARIARLEVIGDPSRLRELDISVSRSSRGAVEQVGRHEVEDLCMASSSR